ncbi:unnamed protein product [Tetraodon nigroviridis]|uniref:Chromosome undetermined SCAF14347, whole genome shotgun sequence n=1 Tax=Tetraodon nigroviridis TaxID=99883 RepID=Q4SST2_TETNG|nr:unnamed protein product [Tetraodon nigroviridis]
MRTSSAPRIPPPCAHAAGILRRTSCSNSRGKVRPQEWKSFSTTNFVDISHPRSSQQPPTGFKDRPVVLNSTFGILLTQLLRSELSRSSDFFVGVPRGKMRSSTQPRSFAGFAVVLTIFWGLQRAPGAAGRTCPSPCVCSGELLDCSRLKRGQIPERIPEWTVQL